MTETFAHLSNNAVYSATFVFALAMIAHLAEWAMSRDVVTAPVAAERRALVAADAAARGAATGAAMPRVGYDSAPGVVAPADGASAVDPHEDEDELERSDRYGRIGIALTILGTVVLGFGVVCRGIAAQRVPWGNMYEFAITGCLAVSIAYLVMVRLYSVRWLGLLVTAFVSLVLGIAVVLLYRPLSPLVPALHSYWLMIHVSAAAIAGGAFTVGALASVLFLVRTRAESRAAGDPELRRSGFVWRLPPAESIDRVAYRVHAFAFPMWTFAVLCGAIWAQYAWGKFWGWDPKEVWAFITWVAYAAYLHARATAGWQGRAAAYVALLGYATFIFNFVGINLFGSGLHSYSGM